MEQIDPRDGKATEEPEVPSSKGPEGDVGVSVKGQKGQLAPVPKARKETPELTEHKV